MRYAMNKYMWYLVYGVGAYIAYSIFMSANAEARDINKPKPLIQGGA
jgi:hypothetical protein